MKRVRALRLPHFCSLFAFAVFGSAAPAADDKGKVEIDPKADQTLHQLCDYLRNAENFRVKATMDWRMQEGERQGHEGSRYYITLQRPNRFALLQKGGEVGATVVSDGKQLFAHVPHRESYTLQEEPADLNEVGEVLAIVAVITNMSGFALVRALIQDDPYRALMDGVTKLEYASTQKIKGTTCDHVKLTSDTATWELWIESGKEPVIACFETNLPSDDMRVGDRGLNPRGRGEMKIRVTFRDWKIDGKVKDKQFKYKIPKEAQRIDSALELAYAYPPHPLVGKKAPKIKLDLLDGGELKLSEHKGEHIVVLDFWATWCGPCIVALPPLIEVTDAFKDRGVRFYAINQQESKSDIKSFLSRRGLEFPIALDSKGAAGSKYNVVGIPQTVIIGKDGTVQAVHRGFGPDLKKTLTEELEALLAGKRLAEKE